VESVREEFASTGGTTVLERIEVEIKSGKLQVRAQEPLGFELSRGSP
jgi:hypothetical protein